MTKRKTDRKGPRRLEPNIYFRPDPELGETLRRLAADEDRTISAVMRRLLLRALAQNEKTA
jgi:hypothetical protein